MFANREDAGIVLAQRLKKYERNSSAIVLGLARGGVIVAATLASELHLPFNVVTPRKIGAPGNPELAIGAIAEDGTCIWMDGLIHLFGVSSAFLEQSVKNETQKIEQRLRQYRSIAPFPDLTHRLVILVDDGVATGATMRAEIRALRHQNIQSLVIAVPVAAPDSLALIEQEVDEVVCLYQPEDFMGVGCYYDDFREVSDAEVLALLSKSIN